MLFFGLASWGRAPTRTPDCAIVHLAIAFLLFAFTAQASFDLGYGDDSDLTNFVTRPEIKAPKFIVAVYEPEKVVSGYWFVGPYANIIQETIAKRYYQACSTGPAIYDSKGELVWSGACLFKNNNACDLRVHQDENGRDYLSVILHFWRDVDPAGYAMILNDKLEPKKKVAAPVHLVPFNMHEFNVIDEGKSVLYIAQHIEFADVSELAIPGLPAGMVLNQAIREVDLTTGDVLFEWWAHEHIPYSASYFDSRRLRSKWPDGWDWIHMNAVEKTPDGDYIMTARYTDAIYKISGKDGSLIWTLGGRYSDFQLQGFNFSRPHDARWVAETDRYDTISFLDNAGDEHTKTAEVSTAYIIRIDKKAKPPFAKVMQAWERPDGGRSEKRGNFQLLPNGNAFIGWSENSYISEHSPTGELLMEAQFESERFVTYRSYKFNFTSHPAEPPAVRGFVYGATPSPQSPAVSVFYVSWNGATEVAEWRFYDGASAGADALLGSQKRQGFETSFHYSDRFVQSFYAEAVDRTGNVLGKSEVVDVELPEHWLASVPDVSEDASINDVDSSSWSKEEL